MKLALGTAQFGMSYGINNMDGQVSQNAIQQILKYASLVGIHTIDTAIAYGSSEQCLGLAGVDTFEVISKLPAIPETCTNVEDWISNEVSGSLNRLGVHSLYGLMLHRPDQLYGPMGDRILEALINLKKAGHFRKIGISVYGPDEFDGLFSMLDFDIVQCPFNLIDRRLVSSGALKKLKMRGVEIHTRSSFLQGLLLMERNDIPSQFETWKSSWDLWDEWVRDNDVTRLRACLAYCLSFEDVDRIVVGVDGKSQLEEIVAASEEVITVLFPNLSSDDPKLINPGNWKIL
tara:strand:+ start:1014 stop:1880 length:867 start_codon:yes stop_codon:yes gene_type:complete